MTTVAIAAMTTADIGSKIRPLLPATRFGASSRVPGSGAGRSVFIGDSGSTQYSSSMFIISGLPLFRVTMKGLMMTQNERCSQRNDRWTRSRSWAFFNKNPAQTTPVQQR